jgi:hypothetical protein
VTAAEGDDGAAGTGATGDWAKARAESDGTQDLPQRLTAPPDAGESSTQGGEPVPQPAPGEGAAASHGGVGAEEGGAPANPPRKRSRDAEKMNSRRRRLVNFIRQAQAQGWGWDAMVQRLNEGEVPTLEGNGPWGTETLKGFAQYMGFRV